VTVGAPRQLPEVGEAFGEHVFEPTAVQLFAFSAVTWNEHRIHYDRDYAREQEGYPDVLVQSHLHACFLTQAAQAAFGRRSRLTGLGWQNRDIAVPGDRLTVGGEVTSVGNGKTGVEVGLGLDERNQEGRLCVKGWARLLLPPDWEPDERT
jgi:hydroxyacyl-ACP dehydratase HTD2-like protein with hotdog domain